MEGETDEPYQDERQTEESDSEGEPDEQPNTGGDEKE